MGFEQVARVLEVLLGVSCCGRQPRKGLVQNCDDASLFGERRDDDDNAIEL